ncbi:HK97-gp10 family putative phage morphogenesis protein [Natrinema ejinorense]|uniref:Uncharacterized protein n=1 Tax=Natrinema ejinorense TaxID=373386 RepID=A0A2A5QR47_9EURY|nr:hypothetical protein [Natrinema ejinorense]PCR89317.1 hypothetical protein CP557_01450 [Natrinema ejinorense]
MTGFDFDIKGLEAHKRQLREERDKWTGDGGTWYVGTAVEYAVYLEYGTSKMDPKPFFRPALAEAEQDLSAFVRDNTRKTLSQIDGPRELVKTIAFALERRVKEIITEKGLIESGTMRASVRAVPTRPDDLPTADEVDPSASADIEVSA